VARVSADQVFELVSGNKLTVEQRAIVEQSSLQEPTLVIAGAGSGKTELMMVRILYLVANSFARPDQILGLTFTKKAAAELASRVQQGLIKLRESKPLAQRISRKTFFQPRSSLITPLETRFFVHWRSKLV
jgi:DNA helicase-2/ATP-dependent DNA helicase PcrA